LGLLLLLLLWHQRDQVARGHQTGTRCPARVIKNQFWNQQLGLLLLWHQQDQVAKAPLLELLILKRKK
jgi:hypothetical protein